MTSTVTVAIRVKPGSGRTRVGGRYGPSTLVVAVTAPAHCGRATEAALMALAEALAVRRRDVSLVSGVTAHTKIVAIPATAAERVVALLQP